MSGCKKSGEALLVVSISSSKAISGLQRLEVTVSEPTNGGAHDRLTYAWPDAGTPLMMATTLGVRLPAGTGEVTILVDAYGTSGPPLAAGMKAGILPQAGTSTLVSVELVASPSVDGGSTDANVDATREAGGSDAPSDSGTGSDADASFSIGNSCDGLAATCGPRGDQNCCKSSVIAHGAFNRSNDQNHPATVSSFRLDLFEATVGRFRKFVEAYPASKPTVATGKNPNNPLDNGWNESWTSLLPADQPALIASLKCATGTSNLTTWSDTGNNTVNESRPINCLTWYEAYAFCIWDGGRLPTEAEWNYAAAGGEQQRPYPWSTSPTDFTIDQTYASYACSKCSLNDITRVGAKSPLGDGRWGQADMAGNVMEWTEDAWPTTGPVSYPDPCSDCAFLSETGVRIMRGGSVFSGATPGSAPLSSVSSSVVTTERQPRDASQLTMTFAFYGNEMGVRCARPVE